ncbi:hypothetical protein IW140_002195 [Coemansia sp. RSA 1813]|nr:hypothetical protein EV178_001344 [Coemansia sp. RSA 1646]KAJ1770207.1 hypothetical protein LPJ74_003351 [Coemansia sp. RSA 1843]KAJ2090164.1 hypothetical protein IW138_002795 [Coemansia sp. RSA 986]KAJ2214571.1 hypothetical protein EV179_002829 [Coemansia sp. RSA 487]KAJ2570768.1 hypothetical protein IW140_002195 [Coemansia sp. RSA 1813]
MGLCFSRPHTEVGQQQSPRASPRTGQSSSHTVDFGHTEQWTMEQPVSRKGLERQRNEFWETAPYYEGSAEIWQALRVVSESTDTQLAMAILDSISVTVPTGRFVDGVYDERGVCYKVPQFCVSEPANIIDDGDDAQSDKSVAALSGAGTSRDALTQPVLVRLFSGGDVRLALASDTTVAQMEQKLSDGGHVPTGARVRFFYLGRLLSPAVAPVRDMQLPGDAVLQAMHA